MSRVLIVLGIAFVAAGIAWPWIAKLGLGHLPGDIRIEREGYSFFFPITTCVIVSLVISVVAWLLRK